MKYLFFISLLLLYNPILLSMKKRNAEIINGRPKQQKILEENKNLNNFKLMQTAVGIFLATHTMSVLTNQYETLLYSRHFNVLIDAINKANLTNQQKVQLSGLLYNNSSKANRDLKIFLLVPITKQPEATKERFEAEYLLTTFFNSILPASPQDPYYNKTHEQADFFYSKALATHQQLPQDQISQDLITHLQSLSKHEVLQT